MRTRRLLTIAVVALLLLGSVATLGAASPADQATNDGTELADASSDRSDEVGPSDGLPEQVPDHVGEILDRIGAFLGGILDTLGQALSDLLGGGAASA